MEDYKLDPTALRQEVCVQAHMILVFLKPLAKAITRGKKHSCSGGIQVRPYCTETRSAHTSTCRCMARNSRGERVQGEPLGQRQGEC